ncbi:contractile injection system protein, VgrG/Pvc8 family [Paenibacillus popilliae]|uniref:contractile injection system protein, VgrG/Pvc8 family n=1 Tax=Paenibacillus popilliae TaxID=78057 RepID=UPI00163CA242|nr:contractile injection system protein, VgrG/Pvc8 family [Paenibacillus sp. SDF0028]
MEKSMQSVEHVAGYGHIRVVWAHDIQRILELRIEKRVNEHARLHMRALLAEERGDQDIEAYDYGKSVKVEQLGDDGSVVRTLFCGQVMTRSIHAERSVYFLTLEAISWSYELDIRPKTRSFQPERTTYEDVLERVLTDYARSDSIDTASEGSTLGSFTLQYEETDWSFLKRMASRLGTVLVPEITAESPKLFFGLPAGKHWRLDEQEPYRVRKSFHSSLERGAQMIPFGTGSGSSPAAVYSLESGRCFVLGDRVSLPSGLRTVVTEIVSEMKNGLLLHTYQLCAEEDATCPRTENWQAIGTVLSGIVIDVQRDRVRLRLDADGEDAVSEGCWFPYVTSYAAEGNSGLYWMPEPGDRAQLYLPSAHEAEAVVRGSLRQHAAVDKPDEKVWSGKRGKRISMGNVELKLEAGGGLNIRLNEGNGIHIHSTNSLAISGRDIMVKAGQQVSMKAGQSLYLRGGESSLILDGESDMRSDLLHQEGTVKSPVHVTPLTPVPEPPLMTVEAYEAGQAAKTAAAESQGVTGAQIGLLAGAALSLLGMIPVAGVVGSLVGSALSVLGMMTSSSGFRIGLPPGGGGGTTAGPLSEEEMVQLEMQREFAILLGKVFTDARGWRNPETKESLVRFLLTLNKGMEMAASKIPQDVRVANKNIREAMDIYRNLDRDDPIIWLRLKDINDKLRFGNINPETYNPWEDDFLAPQTKNDIANDIKRLWGSNQEGGQLVDGELAAQNYLYIVDHTSEGAALAGGISGFKGSNRRSPPQQPIKPQGISKGSNIKEIKVNWGQATTFINERFEALQKSVGQLPKNKLAYDGPDMNYKSSTQKPLEPTKNQIEVRKYYPGTEPENSASGSASGKNKNSTGEGTSKSSNQYLQKPADENGTLNIGARGKPTEGAYNIDIDPKASGVHYGDATKLTNIKTGSQSKIIIENPYGYDPLNTEVTRVLSRNGEIIITGSRSNMNKLVRTLDDKGLKIKGERREIPNDGSYLTTDGENIKSPMLDQYTFIKK